jgi:hypothetical protein
LLRKGLEAAEKEREAAEIHGKALVQIRGVTGC